MPNSHENPKCKSCRETIFGLRWQVTTAEGDFGAICDRCHAWLEETQYEHCISCGRIRHETYVDRHPINGRVTCRHDAPLTCADREHPTYVQAAEAVCECCLAYVPEWTLRPVRLYSGTVRQWCEKCDLVEETKSQAESFGVPDGRVQHVDDDTVFDLVSSCNGDVGEAAHALALMELAGAQEAEELAEIRANEGPYDRLDELWEDRERGAYREVWDE